ncbi:MAG: HEAT repeat domain-containing protein [Candidatus Wallbacteria bacterium]|nr:HEAT repeat domain-containing protein [Candidatus Wallbacteria bacterium]
MDFKKEFIDSILSAGDDHRESKFNDLKQRVKAGDSQAAELLNFLANYEEVSVRYYAKKILDDLKQEKSGTSVDDEYDVGTILKSLGESSHGLFDEDKSFKSINIDALIKYLKDPDYKKRIKVVQGAGQMADPNAIPYLINLLSEERHPFVKATLVKVLGGFRDSKVIPVIAEYLKDPDHRIRANAIEGLEQIPDPKVVEFLVPMLQDPEHRVRANAAKVLVKFGKQDVLEVLEKMLSSPALWLNESAIYALGEIGSREGLELLKKKHDTVQREEVRISILKSIAKYLPSQDVTNFLKGIYNALSDKNCPEGMLLSHLLKAGGKQVQGPDSAAKKKKPVYLMAVAAAAILIIAAVYFLKTSQNQVVLPVAVKPPVTPTTEAIITKTVETALKIITDETIQRPVNPILKTEEIPVLKTVETAAAKAIETAAVKKNPVIPRKTVETSAVKAPVIKKTVETAAVPVKIVPPEPVENPEASSEVAVAPVEPVEPVTPVEPVEPASTTLPVETEEVVKSSTVPLNNVKTAPVSSTGESLSTIIDWARTKITRETAAVQTPVSANKQINLDQKLQLFGVDQPTRDKIQQSIEKERKQLNKKFLIIYPQASNSRSERVYVKGFTDFLISNFSKLPGLDVVSREEMHQKLVELGLSVQDLDRTEVAQKLGEMFSVDYVIFGSIREIGNNYDTYYKEFVDSAPQNDEATKNFLQGNLDSDIYNDAAMANMTMEEKNEIANRNYREGKMYFERKDYVDAYKRFTITKRVLKDQRLPYEDLTEYMQLAESNIRKVSTRDRDQLKKSVTMGHTLRILDCDNRKVIWENTFNKEIYYFHDILKTAFQAIYDKMQMNYLSFSSNSLFTGFTESLEAFLRLYKAIDTMDFNVGDRISENKSDDALTLIEQSLKMDSDYSDAYYYRSLVYARKNNLVKALTDANKASQLDPSNIRVRYQVAFYRKNLGDKTGSDLELEKISKIKGLQSGDLMSRAHLDLAYQKFHEGNKNQAFKELQNAMISDPSLGEAYLAMGIYYMNASDYQKAYYALEEADKLYKNSVFVKICLAESLKALEDYDSMVKYLKDALLYINSDKKFQNGGSYQVDKYDISPVYQANAVYYFLGIAFKAKGSRELSQSYFRQCITLEPYSDYAYKARSELE